MPKRPRESGDGMDERRAPVSGEDRRSFPMHPSYFLPVEIWAEIFSFLHGADLGSVGAACEWFRGLTRPRRLACVFANGRHRDLAAVEEEYGLSVAKDRLWALALAEEAERNFLRVPFASKKWGDLFDRFLTAHPAARPLTDRVLCEILCEGSVSDRRSGSVRDKSRRRCLETGRTDVLDRVGLERDAGAPRFVIARDVPRARRRVVPLASLEWMGVADSLKETASKASHRGTFSACVAKSTRYVFDPELLPRTDDWIRLLERAEACCLAETPRSGDPHLLRASLVLVTAGWRDADLFEAACRRFPGPLLSPVPLPSSVPGVEGGGDENPGFLVGIQDLVFAFERLSVLGGTTAGALDCAKRWGSLLPERARDALRGADWTDFLSSALGRCASEPLRWLDEFLPALPLGAFRIAGFDAARVLLSQAMRESSLDERAPGEGIDLGHRFAVVCLERAVEYVRETPDLPHVAHDPKRVMRRLVWLAIESGSRRAVELSVELARRYSGNAFYLAEPDFPVALNVSAWTPWDLGEALGETDVAKHGGSGAARLLLGTPERPGNPVFLFGFELRDPEPHDVYPHTQQRTLDRRPYTGTLFRYADALRNGWTPCHPDVSDWTHSTYARLALEASDEAEMEDCLDRWERASASLEKTARDRKLDAEHRRGSFSHLLSHLLVSRDPRHRVTLARLLRFLEAREKELPWEELLQPFFSILDCDFDAILSLVVDKATMFRWNPFLAAARAYFEAMRYLHGDSVRLLERLLTLGWDVCGPELAKRVGRHGDPALVKAYLRVAWNVDCERDVACFGFALLPLWAGLKKALRNGSASKIEGHVRCVRWIVRMSRAPPSRWREALRDDSFEHAPSSPVFGAPPVPQNPFDLDAAARAANPMSVVTHALRWVGRVLGAKGAASDVPNRARLLEAVEAFYAPDRAEVYAASVLAHLSDVLPVPFSPPLAIPPSTFVRMGSGRLGARLAVLVPLDLWEPHVRHHLMDLVDVVVCGSGGPDWSSKDWRFHLEKTPRNDAAFLDFLSDLYGHERVDALLDRAWESRRRGSK